MRAGRGVELRGRSQNQNVDTPTHGFMLFVVAVGGMVVYVNCRHWHDIFRYDQERDRLPTLRSE